MGILLHKVNRGNLIDALAKVVGSRDVLASPRDLVAYSYDATGKRYLPDVVVFPASVGEVSGVMKIAHRHRVPVVPRGAGTNLTGGTLASRGGIILELSRLNHILDIDTAQRRAIVEPGVVNLDLQKALEPLGFMYAPDPASQKSCTLGGNVGEDAGGPHCLKYGVTSNHVCGLEVVLFDGQVVQVGSPVAESCGYDLLGPLVGSEGTLGVATKLALRITRLPESFRTMLAVFETLEAAGQCVSDIIAAGIIPGALELMDAPVIRAVEASGPAGYPLDAEAVLLIELDGMEDGLEQEAGQVAEICHRNSAREVRLAHSAAERERLWQGRRGAFGAVARLRPSYSVQDATVPRTKVLPMLQEVRRIAQKYGLLIGNVAHAGDGNLHPLAMFDNRDAEERARVEEAGKEVMAACVGLGGTLSGEHGIGLEKKDSMPLMFSPSELRLMRRVKAVFDPEGILNPGKVLPQDEAAPAKVTDNVAISKSALDKTGSLHDELVQILGPDNVIVNADALIAYSVDGRPPTLVVFPAHTDHICQVVRACNRYDVSLIPWGNGSKQALGSPLAKAGVILSMKHINRLLELDAGNLTAEVEAGMGHAELQRQLARQSLWFPLEPDDVESATMGGSLAANSSGPGRLAHGTARDLVLGVTVVTPQGEVIRAGGKTVKNVAGYDLRKLFLGSWGTLGVITSAILRLSYLPADHKTLLLRFSAMEDVCQMVRQVSGSILQPESMELIDSTANGGPGLGAGFDLREGELLLLTGIGGSSPVVERHIAEMRALGEANGAREVTVLDGNREKEAWDTQRSIQLSSLRSGQGMVRGKAVVLLPEMEAMFREIRETARKHKLRAGITGHAGNGILYSHFFPGGYSFGGAE
ncbi:MAG: FAD-linked oxidase C-terminal domain-containing protein, partial [Chloroflexota bacterium]|nr:FAD-linked oxidase C-terminal domain-containing protein [Chloroflexota bacterium]